MENDQTPTSSATLESKPDALPTGFGTIMALALLFPTALTFTYFVLLAPFPSSIQQGVYAVGKFVQFAFPVVWVFFLLRTRPRWTWPGSQSIWIGLGFGFAVVLAMFGLYFLWLQPAGFLKVLEEQVMTKVKDMGLDSTWRYAATGVFYALAHSFLEEYYWRWFVYGQLRKRFSISASVAISSLGFMAHHVVLLATFFGWDSPQAYIFSFAVALGGVAWALMYEKSRSLIGPWLSHMVVDAGIFSLGYYMVQSGL